MTTHDDNAKEAVANRRGELRQLLERDLPHYDQLSLDDAQRAADLFRDELSEIENEIARYQSLRDNALTRFTEFLEETGVVSAFSGLQLVDRSVSGSIEESCTHLSKLLSEISVLRRSISTVRVLGTRLGREPELGQVETPDLEAYAAELQEQIAGLQADVDQLAARDKQAQDLLETLADASPFDRPEIVSLFSDSDIECIIDAAIGRRTQDQAVDKRLASIQNNFELAGQLLGYVASRNAPNAISLIHQWAENACGDRLKLYCLCSWLEFIHFQKLVEGFGDFREPIFEFSLASARIAGNMQRLARLRPLIPFGAVSHGQTSIGMKLIQELVFVAENSPASLLLEQIRGEAILNGHAHMPTAPLIEFIDHPAPAAGGPLFRQLRETARATYLNPLREDILAERWDIAMGKWRAYGTLEAMVDHCVTTLSARERRHLEARHRDNTWSYLQTFEEQLEAAAGDRDDTSVSSRITGLVRALSEQVPLDSFSCRVKEIVFSDLSDSGVQWPPPDFGVRVSFGALTTDAIVPISAAMLNSWVQETAGKSVALQTLIADELSLVLGLESREITADTINAFASRGEYVAAERAARGNETLSACFAEVISKRQQELDTTILEEARAAASTDQDISFTIEFYEEAIRSHDFKGAREALRELEALVEKHRLRLNPEYVRMVRFAEHLGLSPIPTDIARLAALISDAKRDATDRRFHIQTLGDSIDKLPASLRPPFEQACRAIDAPNLWPSSEEVSLEIAEWIEYFCGFITKKSASRRQQFASKLASWFISELEVCVATQPNPNFASFERVRQGRDREFWDDDEILRFIQPVLDALEEAAAATREEGEEGSSEVSAQDTDDSPRSAVHQRIEGASRHLDLPGSQDVLEPFRRVVDRLRRDNAVSTQRSCSDSELRRLCAAGRWQDIPARICQHDVFLELPINELAEQECVLVIAETSKQLLSGKCGVELLQSACIAAASLYSSQHAYYITEEILQERAAAFIICMLNGGGAFSSNRRDEAARVIRLLMDSPRGDKVTQAFDKTLRLLRQIRKANGNGLRGDAFIMHCLWEEFTGMTKPATPRADLILSLHHLDHSDILRELARKYAPALCDPIIQCLEVFNQAASNPDAMEEAVQLASIVHEQSSREKIGPWTKAISALMSSQREEGTVAPVTVEVESICADSLGVVINASLVPSRNDWPLSLQLRVLGDDEKDIHSQDLLAGTALVRPRPICIRIPIDNTLIRDGFLRLPYEISGHSNRVDEILVRGSWSWNEEKPVETFLPRDLRHFWPGADGKDVKTRELHHGRHDAMEKIETALAGEDGYQRSLLVIGQRRIGKTSLLNQVINSYPPRYGACCSLFVNVSGLDLNRPSLSCALFERIVQQLESAPGDKNEKLLQEFLKGGTHLRRVLRDIDPTQSLGGALEGMAKALSRVTQGAITRVAFCLDEFQAIFGWKDLGELKALMWDLRQIVQSSKCVSLLMAGSGLTRRLTDSYDEALFGSIDTIELTPFSMSHERDAVYDTFLPASIRNVFLPDEHDSGLVEAAHVLTGGHPWYLAILGLAMGAVFGRTTVTPSMLSVVVEELVSGRISSGGMQFRASNFYGHLFESLNVLGDRETAIAQLVLLYIARNTTTDWRDYSEERLLHNELLTSLCDRKELSDALKALERDQVIAKDRRKTNRVYRISVPIVAEALKHDSDEIEDEALILLKG